MKRIISDIHNAVQNSRKTIEFLKEKTSRNWFDNYPIAIINEISRISEQETLQNLEKIDFFNVEGFSKESYTQEEIEYLNTNTPTVLKHAYCLCLQKPQENPFTFYSKFEHDRWKKIQDDGNIQALIEYSKFTEKDSPQEIETLLRDIMRSAKEIPALKVTGFAWIVSLPQTTKIVDILEYYFLDNNIYVERGRKITYIAWADRLADINMRHFVYPPFKK